MAWVCALVGAAACHGAPDDYFAIEITDASTGRGVPLVELATVNKVSHWTDSNGLIAFHEPGLMGQEVFFHVRSHGYEYPKDFFGHRGVKLRPVAGGKAVIKLQRLNITERLYRLTGQGIYRDTVLLGRSPPLKQPLLNGQVMGQDTVIVTPYRGRLYWFWGDTDRVSYPLGNFAAAGATSALPGHGGLDPALGVDFDYFVDATGFSKQMCPGFGPGLHWIEGVMTVPDETGQERLVSRVSSQKGLMPAYAWHLAVFNDEKQIFESKIKWDITEGHDSAHPFRARVDGVEFLYLYPNFRVKADLESLSDLTRYQAFTCVEGDGKVAGATLKIDRDPSGRAHYTWKPGADRLHPGRLRQLIAQGALKPDEAWIQLHDFESGEPVEAGRGSVYWNDFRQRWVMIVSAKSGEIWFSEGDTPAGPWGYARRVVAHDNYNFYNPTQHPFFDQENGRLIYFEGTYTLSFSGAQEKTPRYDYNQIMYRLDLDDPRLNLPVPVYQVKDPEENRRYATREVIEREHAWAKVEAVAFFAFSPQRGRGGLIPVFSQPENPRGALEVTPAAGHPPLFFALPPAEALIKATVEGPWNCLLRPSDGGELDVTLKLKVDGEKVSGTGTAGVTVPSGEFKDGALKLDVVHDGKAYAFAAALRDGKLAGDWRRTDGSVRGTWSAIRPSSEPAEDRSPAVVPLFEYRNGRGERLYSTRASLEGGDWRREPEPLCRVWRNPMSVLPLDFAARPK